MTDAPPPPWIAHVDGADYARLGALAALGVAAYPHVFDQHGAALVTARQFFERFDAAVTENGAVLADAAVAFAGRLYGLRTYGDKLAFLDVGGPDKTSPSRVQVKLEVSTWSAGTKDYAALRQALRTGDVVGFVGSPCRTKTGELSLEARHGQLLTTNLRAIPPQLDDPERRARERSLDMTVNERVRTTFETRSRIISALRRFCEDRLRLMEVETPTLQMQAGGAAARPFKTFQNALKLPMVMRISPELYLKMCIVGGLGEQGVYEIGKQFRNEDIDESHSPEFTSIELYWRYRDYNQLMTMTEELFEYLARAALQRPRAAGDTAPLLVTPLDDGEPLNFTGPYERISIYDALADAWGVTGGHAGGAPFPATDALDTPEANAFFDTWCAASGVECAEPRTTARLLDKLIGHYIEPRCRNPTFVTDHPQLMCPLAKPHRSRPGLTERFEMFICGREYVNAYTELNNPFDQRREFHAQIAAADRGDEEAQLTDEPFCRAIEYGLPPTAGWGMGIDRLVMLLTGQKKLADVLLFPAMRPLPARTERPAVADPVAAASGPPPLPAAFAGPNEPLAYQARPALAAAAAASPALPPSGLHTVVIKAETKSNWEGRCALAPRHVRELVARGLTLHVQRSATRAFADAEYAAAGATLVDEITDEGVVVGLKETPVAHMRPNRLYVLFSHTFKGQPANMYRMDAFLRRNITVVDYELIRDPAAYALDPKTPTRAMKFGPYAGYGGLIDTLHGVGLRLLHLGYRTPFVHIGRAYEYMTLEDAHLALRRAGDEVQAHGLPDALLPFTVVFTSEGAVASAALEIFKHVQPQRVTPDEMRTLAARPLEQLRRTIFYTVLTHEHMVERVGIKLADGHFNKRDYYAHPDYYVDIFATRYLPHASVLVNGIYWEPRFPRLVTIEQARAGACARLVAIGDLGCDIKGPIEFFSHSTRIPAPFYMYDTQSGEEHTRLDDPSRSAVLILGVDHIPGETPIDASNYFGDRFMPYVETLARHDQRVPYAEIRDMPGHLLHAMQSRHGALVGRFAETVEASIATNRGDVSAARDAADVRD